ncbi:nitrate- and nitrite sensing domain-containing protein [Saccharopolyspora erythraea]|uniref:nitrate- and nitrite sensing domain-containing protein n=1 Tax=Saccharopolyspora erythraea TaxID=1836 RepID=UPI001BAE4B27|nr:nitrate- and nitrite sensing domain-containing protein [Saccharopolyspora erythraea]QUH04740.1 nitrate- and nitrite sensing domain-containing protein [Saccharopolyspora erythraea]
MSSGSDNAPAAPIRASAWSRAAWRITQWRNWRLASKLTAVVLVPAVFALGLGVLQIQDQIEHASGYAGMGRVVTAAGSVRTTVGHLQDERTRSAEFLAGGPVQPQALQDHFTTTDRALEHHLQVLRTHVGDNVVVRLARQDADRKTAEIPQLRKQILGTHLDPGVAVNSYTEIIGALLALDRALISQISSAELTATAISVHELAKIGEEVRLQQAVVLMGLTRDRLNARDIALLGSSEARRSAALREFRATAAPQERMAYDRMYTRPEVSSRETTLQMAMTERRPGESELSAMQVAPAMWDHQSRAALSALGGIQSGLEQRLHDTAFTLQDNSSNLAGLESVILLTALMLAGAVAVLVARQLLVSLALLRRSALDTASTQLPLAVSDILAGYDPDEIEQVPVRTTEEVGEVARAFDTVHSQAVALAAEQAGLRRSYSDSFINVSRRSQSLLERQLRLFEQLERDEEDPDQLATLFQLDHLATRMRRNNENLMVLSGSDLARRFTRPVPPADLVRAAVSEIEHYPRVIVQPLPEARILGYAASDLVRLLAELLDNAANFSAPQTNVMVTGHRRGDGALVIDIVDRGIGMAPDELDAANERLLTDGEIELSTSRRMGLFVVGRLAARHDIDVELHPGPEGTGLRASVEVRAELLVEVPPSPAAARINGVVHHETPVPQVRSEDTLVEEFDWEAAEHDAAADTTGHDTAGQAPPVRNGFHLLNPEPETEVREPVIPAQPSPLPQRSPGGHGNNGTPRHEGVNGTPQRAANGSPQHESAGGPPQHANPGTTAFQPGANGAAFHGGANGAAFQGGANGAVAHGGANGGVAHGGPNGAAFHRGANGTRFQHRTGGAQAGANGARFHGGANGAPQQHAAPVQNGYDLPTPIFDDLASAWFQVSQPPDPDGVDGAGGSVRWPARPADDAVYDPEIATHTEKFPAARPDSELPPGASADVFGTADDAADGAGTNWAFPNDQARRHAEEVSAAEPEDYTSVGLPLRVPRANLIAGSAAGSQNGDPALLQRDPDVARGRLSSFQNGLRRGRHRQEPTAEAAPAVPEQATPIALPAPAPVPDGSDEPTELVHPVEIENAPAPPDEEVDYTSAGLPRRNPRAQLLPSGSAAGQPAAAPRRDADLMRGRLTSFQRGVREGKHTLREHADGAAE